MSENDKDKSAIPTDIEAVLDLTVCALMETGASFSLQRIPFTYHHDLIRQSVTGSLHEGEHMLSRGDVAKALTDWAGNDDTCYVWTAVAGCVEYLCQNNCLADVPEALQAGIETYADTQGFRDFIRDRITEYQIRTNPIMSFR